MELKDITNSDVFFYYGQSDIKLECESDLMLVALQGSRSLYYNRQESGGIVDSENHPSGYMYEVLLRYAIAKGVSYRNSQVTDGIDGTKDRRIAVSQNFINFKNRGKGKIDVNILYFLYTDYTKPQTLTMPVGGA